MGLFGRKPAVEVTISPTVVSPRQTVTATVATTAPVDRVTSATLSWGYTNFYRYHWAGHADSAAAAMNDDLFLIGEVGTNYGGDRDTEDWVSVTNVDLPIATSEFTGGSAQFRIPSWAPASSKEIARWSCRLTVQRDGRDIEHNGYFTVLIGRQDVDDVPEPVDRYDGSGETAVDIVLPSAVYAAGEPIRGQIILTPTKDLPDGDLRVSLQYERESHPLTRRPCATGWSDGATLRLGKNIPLRAGAPISLPFELQVPTDAAPTAAAVHSSMSWCVAAQMYYAGWSGPMTERVRRGILVVNAVG